MERLVEAVQRHARLRAQRFVGRTLEVLVEGPSRTDPDRLRGRTRHNKVVNFVGPRAPGELTQVRIERGHQPDALGRGAAAGARLNLLSVPLWLAVAAQYANICSCAGAT